MFHLSKPLSQSNAIIPHSNRVKHEKIPRQDMNVTILSYKISFVNYFATEK